MTEGPLPALELTSNGPGIMPEPVVASYGTSDAPPIPSNSGSGLQGIYTDDQARSSPKGTRSSVRNNRYALDWAYADECIEAMGVCCLEGMLYTHEACEARVYVPWHCDERSCATCSPRRIRRFRRRYEATVRTMARPALLTFTIPNVFTPEELPQALEDLTKGFERIRRSKAWPKCKGFRAIEITWSGSKGYHPHLHALADFPWLADWDKEMGAIVDTWSALTGAKHHVDLSRPKNEHEKEGLVREAIKYTCKQWELEDSSLRAILAVIGKRKMFSGFGGLKMAEVPDEESGALCPKCHEKPFSIIRRKLSEGQVADLQASPTWPEIFTGWYFKDRENRPGLEPIGFESDLVGAVA